MTFLILHWRESLIIGLLLGIALMAHAWESQFIARGAATERARIADSTLVAMRPLEAKADTVYRVDTLRLSYRIATFDTLRDTVLKHLTDTVVVKQFVTQADSMAKACTELANDCATKIRLAERKADILQQLLHEQQPVKIATSCVQSNVLVGVVGIAVGYLAHR